MHDKELKRQAYLDDQLSVDELIEYETDLADDELKTLQKERQFNDELSKKLKEAPACPSDLWQKLETQMKMDSEMNSPKSSPVEQTKEPKAFTFDWKMMALAALLLINAVVIYSAFIKKSAPESLTAENILVPKAAFLEQDLQTFASHGDSVSDFNDLIEQLKARNPSLKINIPPEGQHHKINPLAIKKVSISGNEITQLHFECCSKPILVLIVPKDYDFKVPRNLKVHIKIVGNYKVICLGSKHDSKEVSDLFTEI